MYGNVGEWCQNRHSLVTRAEFDFGFDDPMHVFRGSTYDATPATLRSACRQNMAGNMRIASLGFRIARTMPAAGEKLKP
jgi:formylglycine-generating enzyme required for sulfatase activity